MLTGEIKGELVKVGFSTLLSADRLLKLHSLMSCMPPTKPPRPCLQVLTEMVERHKAARALVSEETVDAFMTPRPMSDLWG